MNEAVLQSIEEHALTPEAIEQVIQLSERDEARSERDRLEKERAEVEKRIERLVSAIERGAEVSSVVMKLRELEERRKTIDEEIAGLRPVPRLAPEVVESRLAEWRRLIRGNTTQALLRSRQPTSWLDGSTQSIGENRRRAHF